MLTLASTTPADINQHQFRSNLVRSLFLVSVVFAPIEIKLVASFTIYDLLILFVAVLVISSGNGTVKLPPVGFLIAIFVFLLFAFLSGFRATYPLEALTQTIQFVFIFFVQLPIILTVVKTPSMLRLSIVMLLVGTLVVNGWAMIFQEEGFHNRLRTFASGNSNRLGYPAAYMLPFLLCLLFDSWRNRRLFAILLLVATLYILVWGLTASGSRSATVGTVSALIIFLTCRHGFHINIRFLLRGCLVLILLGAIGYLFYQTNFFPSILRERVDRTLNFEESLIADRTRLAVAGWRAFIDSPLIGVGLDNFRYVSTQYHVNMVSEQVPHNLWIQFLAQIGLIGTVAFFVLIVFWLWQLFKEQQISYNQQQRDVLWAFIAAMAGLMTILMFIPLMIHRHYWLIYGLGLAATFSTKEMWITKVQSNNFDR